MEKSLFGLQDKRIVVFGGGGGIGEATCKLLSGLGAKVAVLDVSSEQAERVAGELAGALPVVCNVLDDTDLVQTIARIEADWGPIDGMATIIGATHMDAAIAIPMEAWDREFQLNLRYVFLAAREVARHMITRGAPGAMAFVGSVDGILGAANHAAYGACKAAMRHLAMSLAGEWSPYGVRVNVVAPGSIATPRHPRRDAESERATMARVPMPRRGDVQDIANAIGFLLSDMASYITGQTLAVDGGHTTVGPLDYSRLASWKPEKA